MNRNVDKLRAISEKGKCRVIGLMSGTSLDGLDIALCGITGCGRSTGVNLEQFTTVAYSRSQKEKLREVVSVGDVNYERFCVLNAWLGTLYGKMVLNTLGEWQVPVDSIDFIASHGQTVCHAPAWKHQLPSMPNATFQIGDGDHIAVQTGILTISDFRQKHIASGGEGAPLAGYIDELLFFKEGRRRILLNIGGIANFTLLDGVQAGKPKLITDTGPGNTLIDGAVHHHFPDCDYDKDGAIAKTGAVSEELLDILKSDPFFSRPLPKSTGTEYFSRAFVDRALEQMKEEIFPADLVATLTRLTADTIVQAIRKANGAQSCELYVSGGGYHNPVIMNLLQEQLPHSRIIPPEQQGFNPDAREAVIFAVLANETLRGKGIHLSDGRVVTLGKVSFPG